MVYSNCQCRFLLIFDLLFILFRIALWPYAGKEQSLWLFICFNLSAVLVVRAPFPFGVWGRMWHSIVLVPDHSLFIYLAARFCSFIKKGK